MNALVIDDSRANLLVVRNFLHTVGYTVMRR